MLAQTGTRRIIAGHTRVKAAVKLGLDSIPVRYMDVPDDVAEKLALADNKLNEASEWDVEILAALALDYDLTELGWDQREVDELQADLDVGDAWGSLGDSDKPKRADGPVSIKLLCSQVAQVETALHSAMLAGSATRGDALAQICEEWNSVQSG